VRGTTKKKEERGFPDQKKKNKRKGQSGRLKLESVRPCDGEKHQKTNSLLEKEKGTRPCRMGRRREEKRISGGEKEGEKDTGQKGSSTKRTHLLKEEEKMKILIRSATARSESKP